MFNIQRIKVEMTHAAGNLMNLLMFSANADLHQTHVERQETMFLILLVIVILLFVFVCCFFFQKDNKVAA